MKLSYEFIILISFIRVNLWLILSQFSAGGI
jgi:hypothetical protein